MVVGYTPNTPVHPDVLQYYLQHYPKKDITQKLVNGFKHGFDIGCQQTPDSRVPPPNQQGVINNKSIARKKIMEEVHKGHMLGPYTAAPLPNLICSPINLVPKVNSLNKHCLVYNLS